MPSSPHAGFKLAQSPPVRVLNNHTIRSTAQSPSGEKWRLRANEFEIYVNRGTQQSSEDASYNENAFIECNEGSTRTGSYIMTKTVRNKKSVHCLYLEICIVRASKEYV